MIDNSKPEGFISKNEGKSKSCSYIFSSGEKCRELRYQDDSFCFWHSANIDKSGIDIKSQLEEKARNGESMEGYQLEGTNLEDIYLIGADLRNANLKRANIRDGHLYNINLKDAHLFKTNFQNANLRGANFENVELLGTILDGALLERVSWGKHSVVKNEVEAEKEKTKGNKVRALERYLEAEEIYRNIKTNMKNRGFSSEAGEFFHREMIMKRKQMRLLSMERLWSKVVDMICGYGEKPFRIVTTSFGFIILMAITFCFLGIKGDNEFLRLSVNQNLFENLQVVFNCIYYSFVTYTTAGYGDFTTIGIGKIFSIFEAYSGVFLMALFVITIYKNTMER